VVANCLAACLQSGLNMFPICDSFCYRNAEGRKRCVEVVMSAVWLMLYPIAPEPNLGPRLSMTDPAHTPPRAIHRSHSRSFVCY
jgi:hypothetical protein